jgi:hypothetical protein
MVLYLLRSNLNKNLLINQNGTLKVYHDYNIVKADAQIFEAKILCLDYNYLLEFRIQQVIQECKKQNTPISVHNIVLQSLFSTGGTLTGKEKEIQKYIQNGIFHD